MIIRKKFVRIEEREHVRDGQNSVFASFLLETPQLNGAGRLFQKMVIPPMCGIGYHEHEKDSESYYVLSGSGVYNDNGEEVRISEGDLTFTPDGCGHSVYNDTDTNLVILACILYNFTPDKDVKKLRTIRKAGTRERAELHEPFGGKGDFYGDKLLVGDDFTGAGRLYNIVHLLPGCELGYHEHHGETEVFYVLKGKGTFTDDGLVTTVEPGDVLITGTNHAHGMRNDTDEEVVYAALIYFDMN